MADRVPGSIRIGGALPRYHLAVLVSAIEAEGVVDSLGEWFRLEHITGAEPLDLFANDVAWGRFDALEAFCVQHRLPFARWSGSCPGAREAERVVSDGTSEPRSYTVTENDVIVVTAAEIRSLGTFDAVLAFLGTADIDVAPLTIVDGGEEI